MGANPKLLVLVASGAKPKVLMFLRPFPLPLAWLLALLLLLEYELGLGLALVAELVAELVAGLILALASLLFMTTYLLSLWVTWSTTSLRYCSLTSSIACL